MSLRTVVPALLALLALSPALAGEAPEPPPTTPGEEVAPADEPETEPEPPDGEAPSGEAAPGEEGAPAEGEPGGDAVPAAGEDATPTGAAGAAVEEEAAGDDEAGEGDAPRRLPGAEAIDRLRERAEKSPAAPGEKRLERAAQTASRIIRPLPKEFAVVATIVGFVLMLFGQRLFRTGIVLYFMALVGMIGREIGQQYDDFAGPLIGGLAGCVVGAGVALPLRALVRALVGGLTGGVLASILIQSFTSDLAVTLVAVGAGIAVSGLLTFFFPKPLLVIGFSLFGAVTASIGILSVATDPVMIEGGPHLAYGAAHISGVIFAAALGVLFQSHLEDRDGDDD